MQTSGRQNVTRFLARARQGDEEALHELVPLVYDVLRRLSRRERRRAGDPETISTTELIHEAYLKVAPGTEVDWQDRAHFYRVTARAMRQVLVDRARRRETEKRKEERLRLTMSGRHLNFHFRWHELLALDQAMDRLNEVDGRLHTLVELRFFGGLTEEEVAGALGLSPRTVRRDWAKARLILHRELYPNGNVRGEALPVRGATTPGGTRPPRGAHRSRRSPPTAKVEAG